MICCCWTLCGWVCSFTVIVVVDIVGTDNSPSGYNPPIRVLFLNVRRSDRMCRSLSKLGCLTVLGLWGNFAYNRVSIIWCARGQKARSEQFLSSSRKSESDFLLVSKMILCHLCFAVACACGLTYFCRNMMSMPSSFRLLLAFLFLKVRLSKDVNDNG